MRIDDILNIIDAELVNAGFISEISGFADSLKDVKEECLFISNSDDDIKEAINRGAYAILSSEHKNIIDNEIAWIYVNNIDEALFKLIKYKLLNKKVYFFDKLTTEIIDSINKDKRLVVFDKADVKVLKDYDYYVTSNSVFRDIATQFDKEIKIYLIKSTLFTTKLFYKKEYEILFPSLYLDKLQNALAFFEEFNLEYFLKNISISRFKPVFINKLNEVVEFGNSDRVVVFGIKKDEYFIKDINFIFEKVKYANVKFFDIFNKNEFFNSEFNFAILVDIDIKLKQKKIKEVTLF